MAFVILRLKLKLTRQWLSVAGAPGLVGVILAIVTALAAGGGIGVTLGVTRLLAPRTAGDVVAGTVTVLFVLWALGPVLAATSTSTVEASDLVTFPLTGRQLIGGLVLASTVGFGGVVTVLAMAGAVVSMARSVPAAVISLAAVVGVVAMCIAASRLIGTVISAGARSRRWRDVALFAAPATLLAINIAGQVWVRRTVRTGTGRPGEAFGPALDMAVAFIHRLPTALPARAMSAAAEGHLLIALAALAGTFAFVAVLLLGWWLALQRVLTTTPPSAPAKAGRRTDLFPWCARWLPRTRVGAVAALELKLVWRDPRQRAALIAGAWPLVLIFVPRPGISGRGGPWALLLAAIALMVPLAATNLYGFDGEAHAMNVAAGDDARRDLLGKLIARALITAMFTILGAGLFVALYGVSGHLLSAVFLSVAAAGIGLSMAVVMSVALPFPLPRSAANVFASGNMGQGLVAGLVAVGGMLAGAIVLVPLGLGLALGPPGVRAVLAATALAVGAISVVAGFRIAVRVSGERQPELLAKVSPRHA